MTTTEQDIGALKADVANLKNDSDEAKGDRKIMLEKIVNIEKTLAKAEGYWKMGLTIAGFSGAIASFVTWVLSWVPSLPKH